MLGITTQWGSNSQLLKNKDEFQFCCFECEDTEVLSTNVSIRYGCVRALWVSFLCVGVCSYGYSQCELPWFQGEVVQILPISGASLRDILGSLILSIVGGTKPLSFPSPPPSSFLSSYFSFFLSLLTILLHSHELTSYLGLHWLMDCSLLPNCLGSGPLRHVIWGTSGTASPFLCFVNFGRNARVMNNYNNISRSFFQLLLSKGFYLKVKST